MEEKGDTGYPLLPSYSTSSLPSKSSTDDAVRTRGEGPDPAASKGYRMLTAANILLFLTTVGLFFLLPYRRPSERNWALKQVSSYSPILDDVDVPIVDYQIEGVLFPSEDPLIGRLEPGPDTDELWQDFEIQRSFVLNREQVIALGKDPVRYLQYLRWLSPIDKSVKYPNEEFGLGEDAYMAGLDVFHQLHCFDAIRKEAFKDYYFDGEQYHSEGYGPSSGMPKREHTEIWWVHLRHCTDIIVQALMCNADTSMTTMTWLETQQRPWPDFSVNKKCKSFDAVKQWRDENALDVKKAGSLMKGDRPDQTKISDYYWRLYGNDTVKGDNRHHPLWN